MAYTNIIRPVHETKNHPINILSSSFYSFGSFLSIPQQITITIRISSLIPFLRLSK